MITLSTVFYSRSAVVTSIVNNYLIQHNSALTCIDFTLNNNFDLVITHLCIDSPHAEIELLESIITWRFDSHYLQADKIANAISAINIKSAIIRTKDNFYAPAVVENSVRDASKMSELPASIRQLFNGISTLTVPIALNIENFSYQLPKKQGVHRDNKADSKRYYGRLSASAQQLYFSLGNSPQTHFISVDAVRKDQTMNAEISADLAQLRSFSMQHHHFLTTEFSDYLVGDKKDSWSVEGQLKSQINWHQQVLSIDSTLNNFRVEADKTLTPFGAVNVEASYRWKTHLADENIQVDFTPNTETKIKFDHPVLVDALVAQGKDQQLITWLQDNVINEARISLLGSLKLDFSSGDIKSDGIKISAINLNEALKLSLNEVAVNYSDTPRDIIYFQHAKFSLSGQANIAQLTPYTQEPVRFTLLGKVEQQNNDWQLTLAPKTSIALSQLVLKAEHSDTRLASVTEANNTVAKQKTQAGLTSLISHWQGKVFIARKGDKSQTKSNNGVTFDLQTTHELTQLNIPQVIKISTLQLASTLKGNIDNIAINTKVVVDNIPIATAKVTGDLHHPSVTVSAQGVLLTDLLALKVKLPVELKLIDGTIDYHLTGHLKNSDDLMANPMILALKVQDVTGEVDGIWLQELNWQQQFILQNDQIKSIDDNTTMEHNLTIAKVETATPIHNIATKTTIDFSPDNIKLLAQNSRGNLLGGRFDIAKAQWPFNKALPVNLTLTNIDLEKLLELDKKQGIVVTGKISGELPIYYDGEHFLIKEGNLHNVGGGLIQVYNNPAVEELKASGTQLKLAFDALENLHYHLLSSDVSMADDGYMLLVTAIKGRNPDLDNDVNLNLNLSYDLLGLLESLNITELYESKVLKGLQH